MDTAEEILVVILAAALAIFLILAIVIAALVIRLMRSLQRITDKAEAMADSAEKTVDAVRGVVGQASLFRFVQSIIGMAQKRSKEDEKSKRK